MDLWHTLLSTDRDPALYAHRHDAVERWPRSRLIELAERHAASLRGRGVERGTRVACVLTNTPETCAAVLGIWLAGGVVVSLPVIARGLGLDLYRRQVAAICALAESHLLLIEGRFVPFVEEIPVAVVSYEGLAGAARLAEQPPGPDEPAFVQFSSGSTHDPRGCVLTPAAIAAQLDMLQAALQLDPERDRGVMWLPLSHDMGFFGGLLMLWAHGIEGLLSSPERFLASPSTWLADCAEFGATITATPALALSLASDAARRQPPRSRIPMRACLVGGDLIAWAALTEADAALGEFGMTLDTFVPAYGLAEATLAVSVVRGGHGPVARPTPDSEEPVVSVGPPLPGVEVRVDGDGDGPVGELRIRSPSLASGYLGDPVATSRTFVNGELITSDLGFLEDGQLHVVGRVDDVFKVGARKVWATEVEATMGAQPGVRAGNCALVELRGGAVQRIVLVAEATTAGHELVPLARRLARTVRDTAGLGVHECVFLDRGLMPKTPSGKLQRHRVARLVASDSPAVIERVQLRAP
jgi:fatty-acyl-CoA synthase